MLPLNLLAVTSALTLRSPARTHAVFFTTPRRLPAPLMLGEEDPVEKLAALQKQLEELRAAEKLAALQRQLDELNSLKAQAEQASQAPATSASPDVPSVAALEAAPSVPQMTTTPSVSTPAVPDVPSVPSVPSLPSFEPPALPSFEVPPLPTFEAPPVPSGSMTAPAPAVEAAMQTGANPLIVDAAIVLALPVVVLGVSAYVSAITGGGTGSPNPADRPDGARSGGTPGTLSDRGLSAPEVFFKGLENLSKEPMGWFFGDGPSALRGSAAEPATSAPPRFMGAKELARAEQRAASAGMPPRDDSGYFEQIKAEYQQKNLMGGASSSMVQPEASASMPAAPAMPKAVPPPPKPVPAVPSVPKPTVAAKAVPPPPKPVPTASAKPMPPPPKPTQAMPVVPVASNPAAKKMPVAVPQPVASASEPVSSSEDDTAATLAALNAQVAKLTAQNQQLKENFNEAKKVADAPETE